jgi:hypothetical protein
LTPQQERKRTIQTMRHQLGVIDELAKAIRNYLAFSAEETLRRIEADKSEDKHYRDELLDDLRQASDAVQAFEQQRESITASADNKEIAGVFGPLITMFSSFNETQLQQARQRLIDVQRELEELEAPQA